MKKQQWREVLTRVAELAEVIEEAPELRPLVVRMLDVNGSSGLGAKVGGRPARKGHTLSLARRRAMSIAAKKRWAKAKRAGKNTIGGAD
jgi:hypothetical protein